MTQPIITPATPKLETSQPSVAELLALSRSAHQRYRSFLPSMQQGRTLQGDTTLARAALQDAQRLRLAADAQDLGHTDPAWQQDPIPHSELIKFYAEALGKTR